ncbi:MAG: hypothetical protein IKV86_02335 [Clostridia bacterium]|nr:hypothetical protein [Clostridia bacterium]
MNNNEFQTTYASSDPQVDALVEGAFGKGLAATIICGFPIASIIALVLGNTAVNMVEQARQMAAQRGVNISGKNIAAQILGKIGKIAGIAMTIFWAVYFLILFSIILAAL